MRLEHRCNRRQGSFWLAGLVCAAILCSCSQDEMPTEHGTLVAFEDRNWTIGFSNASEANTWRTALRESIEEEVAQYENVELLITDANDSPAKQVADM